MNKKSMFGDMPKEAGSKIEPLEAGSYPARCIQMIDLGTQEFEYMGENKSSRKIRLTWEIPSEKVVFNEEDGEKPRVVGAEYTWSFHAKSNFRKLLEGWRGKKLTDEEINNFDENDIIDKECLVNIVHDTGKDGRVYANVSGISPIIKGMKVDPQINDFLVFSLNHFDQKTFDLIPEWIQNKIKESPEYKALEGNEVEYVSESLEDATDLDEILNNEDKAKK